MIVQVGHTYRHKKRGGEYIVLHIGKMQALDWLHVNSETVDLAPVVVYRALSDQSIWVRPKYEFEDGRFEKL